MSDEHVELHRDSKGRLKGDETPPQNCIIFVAAVMTVITLFGLKYVFDSYLDRSETHVRREHIAESHASGVLAEYRAHAQDQLRDGPMTIGDAMTQLAERGRGAFVQIRPVQDDNTGPREGWAAMPVVAAEPAPRAEPQVVTVDEIVVDDTTPQPAPEEGAAP